MVSEMEREDMDDVSSLSSEFDELTWTASCLTSVIGPEFPVAATAAMVVWGEIQ